MTKKLQACLHSAINKKEFITIMNMLNSQKDITENTYKLDEKHNLIQIINTKDDTVLLGLTGKTKVDPHEDIVYTHAFSYNLPLLESIKIEDKTTFKSLNDIIIRLQKEQEVKTNRLDIYGYINEAFGVDKWNLKSSTQDTKLEESTKDFESYECTAIKLTKYDHENKLEQNIYKLTFSKPGEMSIKAQLCIMNPKDLNADAPFVLYYSSGGYFLDLSQNDIMPLKKVTASDNRIAVVKYPLAPKYSIAHIAKAANLVFNWVQSNKSLLSCSPKSKFILAGFSAGAGLAAYIAGEKDNAKLINNLFLASPFIGLDSNSLEKCNDKDPNLTKEQLETSVDYCRGIVDLTNEKLFPIFRKREGLEFYPDTVVCAGNNELLINISKDFTKQLQSAGVNAKYIDSKGEFHTHFQEGKANEILLETIASSVGKDIPAVAVSSRCKPKM